MYLFLGGSIVWFVVCQIFIEDSFYGRYDSDGREDIGCCFFVVLVLQNFYQVVLFICICFYVI